MPRNVYDLASILLDVVHTFQHHWIRLVVGLLVLYCFRERYRHGLRSIPGPFLASFTNLWRLVDVAKGDAHNTLLKLHRKHNSQLIRLGPKCVSIADPEAIRTIYGIKSGYNKVIVVKKQKKISNAIVE